MRAASGMIDWDRTEEHAMTLSDVEINAALNDIIKTLGLADELDRIDGGDRGGYYRDEASVLRRVWKETVWDRQRKRRVKRS